MLRLRGVSKVYPDGTRAVSDVNLDVEEGEFVVLIGRSGCGKTTTLKLVNRLIEPTSGTIYVKGKDTRTVDPVVLRRSIGYVIQHVGLFPHMNVVDNISVVPRLLGWPKEKREKRAEELLEMVGMEPAQFRHKYPRELSGGQQQRVGVLRALASDPDLILMDEPFGALDPITRELLQDEFKRLQKNLGKTILFVTHDIDEALKLADRIVLMKDGKVHQTGTPDEILRQPADVFVRTFIGPERLVRKPDRVLVEEIMIRTPAVAMADDGLRQGLEIMRQRRTDGLLIVDPEGKLEGYVTVSAVQKNLDVASRLGEVSKPVPVFAIKGESVRDAVTRMVDHRLSYLPVLDAQGVLQGLITRSSLVDVLVEMFWSTNNGEQNGDQPLSLKGGIARNDNDKDDEEERKGDKSRSAGAEEKYSPSHRIIILDHNDDTHSDVHDVDDDARLRHASGQ
ncbi:MAG TPA: betaine/proline/choline family ABC transporter ATP-binding protein [Clostridia bacterium]|nr:betaine/proline/choline family ABC transporter ATP-binding protein [Clostridia bacterium]